MNAEQAARLLGVSAKTVHRRIAQGVITATYKNPQELEITNEQVEKLRQELEREKSRRLPDISLTNRIAELERQVTEQEHSIAELEQTIVTLQSASVQPNRSPLITPENTPAEQKATDLPQGCILASIFAANHGVKTRTFADHIKI